MILRDSSWLVSLFHFVTTAENFILRTLPSSCGAACFKIYQFFKMAGLGLALASTDIRSFTVLLSGSKDFVCLIRATELRSCIASFETTGNLETCIFLR